jgi:hypothetical protein
VPLPHRYAVLLGRRGAQVPRKCLQMKSHSRIYPVRGLKTPARG